MASMGDNAIAFAIALANAIVDHFKCPLKMERQSSKTTIKLTIAWEQGYINMCNIRVIAV